MAAPACDMRTTRITQLRDFGNFENGGRRPQARSGNIQVVGGRPLGGSTVSVQKRDAVLPRRNAATNQNANAND
jgi:hypothetical protein